MAEVVANIYLLARKYSGIKRITAAHELAIAESTLKNYELGIAPVQDEMALKMSKLYHTPWLRVQHLEKNPVFCDVFGIMIDQDNLGLCVLTMQKEVNDVVEKMDDIVEDVVEDGVHEAVVPRAEVLLGKSHRVIDDRGPGRVLLDVGEVDVGEDEDRLLDLVEAAELPVPHLAFEEGDDLGKVADRGKERPLEEGVDLLVALPGQPG